MNRDTQQDLMDSNPVDRDPEVAARFVTSDSVTSDGVTSDSVTSDGDSDSAMAGNVEYGVDVQLTDIGYGVFARRSYEEEEVIGLVEGKIFHDPDHSSEYAVDLGENISLEPGPPFRFLNHSCEPNCHLVVFDDEPSQLYLVSTLDVEPGEALTIDYEWPAEEAVPCKCGKPSCRGWIVAEDQVHLILERRTTDRTA